MVGVRQLRTTTLTKLSSLTGVTHLELLTVKRATVSLQTSSCKIAERWSYKLKETKTVNYFRTV